MISIEAYVTTVIDQPWGTEVLCANTDDYTGKILVYEAGKAGGLQYHVEKDETFYLHSGSAYVDFDNGDGKLVRHKMMPGESFHIPAGAPHRFTAIEECIVFETSTPHFNDRVRVESEYGEPDTGGLQTTWNTEGTQGTQTGGAFVQIKLAKPMFK